MLKQQKLDSASGSGLDRASPVPTVSTGTLPSSAAAAPAAPAPVAAPVTVTTSVPAGIAAPTPQAATSAASTASSSASSGSALSPRRPVIPTLSLPPKGDTTSTTTAAAATSSATAETAPTVNRRKSIDDVLSAKTSQLDFSFDSDSEDESAGGGKGSSTGKYTAPAASQVTSGRGYTATTASKAASKNYDDDVQEFDADEFD